MINIKSSILIVLFALGFAVYMYNPPRKKTFSCYTDFEQIYPDETLRVSLNFTFNNELGLLNIHGFFLNRGNIVINRKIAFKIRKRDNIYILTSVTNVRFPDDNTNDGFLKRYEPDFFVYTNRSINLKIFDLHNHDYVFFLGTLPTYVCKNNDFL